MAIAAAKRARDKRTKKTYTTRRHGLISRVVFVDLVRACDGIAVIGSSLLGYTTYNVLIQGQPFVFWLRELSAPTLLGSLFTIVVLHVGGLYKFENFRSTYSQATRACLLWSAAIVTLIVLAFLAKLSATYSRGWLLTWWASGSIALASVHVLAGHVLATWQQSGRLRRSIAIYGAGEAAQRVVTALKQRHYDDIDIVGIYDDRENRRPDQIEGYAVTGGLEALIDHNRRDPVETILIALPISAEDRIATLVDKLRSIPADIEVSLDINGRKLIHSGVVDIAGVPALRLVNRPLPDWHAIVKLIEDYVLGSIILLTISPLMLLIAVAIRLDTPGPIIFRQRRFGFNNKPIVVYKFRTMHDDMGDPSGTARTRKNDPRVTRVGRYLRRTSLDELPQFINVLQGRLSIVGPRPHALTMKAADKLYHEAVAAYAVRHRVKPGVTGWAQINGLRGETDTMEKAADRIAHDLYYIDNWSLPLDLKIIALTVVKGFQDPNAY